MKCFYSTTDHTCDKPGCCSVLVLKGNMKNALQVCVCRDVGELKFAEMNGSVVVGMSIQVKGSGQKRSKSHLGSFFIFAQKWLIFCM